MDVLIPLLPSFKLHVFTQYEHFYVSVKQPTSMKRIPHDDLQQWIDSAACGCAIASDCLTAGSLIVILRARREQTMYKK